MDRIRQKIVTPARVNTHKPAKYGIVENPYSAPSMPPLGPEDVPRAWERANDLAGEPGNKAWQWRELGDYLNGRGLGSVPDQAVRALAVNTTRAMLDTARLSMNETQKRGVFRFENQPFVEYLPSDPTVPDPTYAYPVDLDMHLPYWIAGSALHSHVPEVGIEYDTDTDTFAQEMVDPEHGRIVRECYPFRETGPRVMPERLVDADTGLYRDVVTYEVDTASYTTVAFGPAMSKFAQYFPANNVVAEMLLRQTAGPPLGTSSSIVATLASIKFRSSAPDVTVLRSSPVTFDSNGTATVALRPATNALGNTQLVNAGLQFRAPSLFSPPIPRGTKIEIHWVRLRTLGLPRTD